MRNDGMQELSHPCSPMARSGWGTHLRTPAEHGTIRCAVRKFVGALTAQWNPTASDGGTKIIKKLDSGFRQNDNYGHSCLVSRWFATIDCKETGPTASSGLHYGRIGIIGSINGQIIRSDRPDKTQPL